jgi:hypothetical protein
MMYCFQYVKNLKQLYKICLLALKGKIWFRMLIPLKVLGCFNDDIFSCLCFQNSCKIIYIFAEETVYISKHLSMDSLVWWCCHQLTFMYYIGWDQNASCRGCLLVYTVSSLDKNIISINGKTTTKISIFDWKRL